MKPLLPMSAARVFFDGIFTSPRVAHPEGVAVHADGSIWCGTEIGELLRIAADGSSVERMGGTGGFLLGIAFDSAGNCFCMRSQACGDLPLGRPKAMKCGTSRHPASAYRTIRSSMRRAAFSTSPTASGQRPAGRLPLRSEDRRRGVVVSMTKCPLPTAWRWRRTAKGLYVVESDAPCISYVPILPDGSAGRKRVVIEKVRNVPDGLAFAPDGSLFISCYEPSRIYRWREDRGLELLIEDPAATVIAHPTNVAFKGQKLYTSNLGRWHITEIDLGGLGG